MNSVGQDKGGEGRRAESVSAPTQPLAGRDSETQAIRSALRRRLLLRGAVGASVVLTAMQPVKTLAKSKKYCHYSGWHSFKINKTSSVAPKQKKCKGGQSSKYYRSKYKKMPKSSHSHSGTTVHFPTYAGSTITLYQTTTFNDLFGSGDGKTIATCLQSSSSTECSYLTALFNAYYSHASGYPFSYQQIYAFWTTPTLLGSGLSSGSAGRDQAALFFQQLDSVG